jgi:hypothetical protein
MNPPVSVSRPRRLSRSSSQTLDAASLTTNSRAYSVSLSKLSLQEATALPFQVSVRPFFRHGDKYVNLSTKFAGLGLAVVVRIVEQLQGQLRVDSQIGGGSRFSFLIPLEVSRPVLESGGISLSPPLHSRSSSLQLCSRAVSSGGLDLDNLVEALTSNPMDSAARRRSPAGRILAPPGESSPSRLMPYGSPKVPSVIPSVTMSIDPPILPTRSDTQTRGVAQAPDPKLRVLIVEVSHGLFLKAARFTNPSQDNDINRKVLEKRLQKDGHTVLWSINGQEGLEKIESDRDFDCILMDIMCVCACARRWPLLRHFIGCQS